MLHHSSAVSFIMWLRNVLNDLLCVLLDRQEPSRMRIEFLSVDPIEFFLEARMITITDEQQVAAFLRPVTAAGNPAQVDGVPTWSVSDPEKLSVAASPDGMSAVLSAVGPLTEQGIPVQVTVEADADLGEGFRPITAVGEVVIRASEAVSMSVQFGTPEPKQ